MDHSLAVFSFRGSPCKATPPSRRSYYHPSPLLERGRRRGGGAFTTVLSPSQPHQPSPLPSPPTPTSPDFDESWPSTSLSPPSLTPEGQTDQSGDSVVAKYMARFRQAQPTSRQERQSAGPTAADFWWLKPSPVGHPDSSAGEEAKRKDLCPASPGQTLPQRGRTLRMDTIISGTHQGHISPLEASETAALDLETLSLQDRAVQLLLRSEISSCSSSSSSSQVASVQVSSEGLSSPPSPSHPDPGQGPSLTRGPAPLTRLQGPPPSVARPEEDILFQWRLRRKLELAQEECVDGSKTHSWPPSRAPVPMARTHGQPKPQQLDALQPALADQLNPLVTPSHLQPSPPAPLSSPHPSPAQSVYVSKQSPPVPFFGPQQGPSVPLCGLQQGPSVPLCGLQQGPSVPLCGLQQGPSVPLCGLQQGPSVPLCGLQQGPSVPLCGLHQGPSAPLCGPQQSPAVLCPREVNPSVSLGSPQPCPLPSVPDSLTTCLSPFHLHSGSPERGCKQSQAGAPLLGSRGPSESKRQDRKPRKARNLHSKNQAPMPEPEPGPLLRGTLEQVVVAHLFPEPSEDSPSPSEAPPSPTEAPHSPTETPPPQELLALASGLLEAAEDSDGTEFEEDALLQVLRARRAELRLCLREVDKRLSQHMDLENLASGSQPARMLGLSQGLLQRI
ncbi:proline and serine-rich protein 3 isoform X2 [Gracilinanus agilis]|uniref:proline and serine-rich protein 3 isoform X2 n=1 Tax=Gracilinanus agilis TaxID=191870 RepID=UPI001CFDCA27|nr:proline and serine-rich protein 3 isoform X2 [Gracilinanus agilis]